MASDSRGCLPLLVRAGAMPMGWGLCECVEWLASCAIAMVTTTTTTVMIIIIIIERERERDDDEDWKPNIDVRRVVGLCPIALHRHHLREPVVVEYTNMCI